VRALNGGGFSRFVELFRSVLAQQFVYVEAPRDAIAPQQRFVNQAAELKRIGAAQKRHEAGLTETFTSIQNRAFRGGL